VRSSFGVGLLSCGVLACGSGARRASDVDAVTSRDVTSASEISADVARDSVGSDTSEPDSGVAETVATVADVSAEEVIEPTSWPHACVIATSDTIALPEASGAALLDDHRALVVADSGNHGQALVLDLTTGASTPLTLPLGGAGDDVEDLTRAPDGTIWGVTSPGWLLAWTFVGDVPTLVLGPLPLADEGDWRCAIDGVNCAANYEGLCLDPTPHDRCVGWAVSKARGVLVCLVAEGAAYRIDPTTTIAVAPADQLSGCDYEPVAPYRLLVAGNLNSGSLIWQVDVAEGTTALFDANASATGNQEALLVTADQRVHSFGDLQDLTDLSPHQVLDCSHAPGTLPSRP